MTAHFDLVSTLNTLAKSADNIIEHVEKETTLFEEWANLIKEAVNDIVCESSTDPVIPDIVRFLQGDKVVAGTSRQRVSRIIAESGIRHIHDPKNPSCSPQNEESSQSIGQLATHLQFKENLPIVTTPITIPSTPSTVPKTREIEVDSLPPPVKRCSVKRKKSIDVEVEVESLKKPKTTVESSKLVQEALSVTKSNSRKGKATPSYGTRSKASSRTASAQKENQVILRDILKKDEIINQNITKAKSLRLQKFAENNRKEEEKAENAKKRRIAKEATSHCKRQENCPAVVVLSAKDQKKNMMADKSNEEVSKKSQTKVKTPRAKRKEKTTTVTDSTDSKKASVSTKKSRREKADLTNTDSSKKGSVSLKKIKKTRVSKNTFKSAAKEKATINSTNDITANATPVKTPENEKETNAKENAHSKGVQNPESSEKLNSTYVSSGVKTVAQSVNKPSNVQGASNMQPPINIPLEKIKSANHKPAAQKTKQQDKIASPMAKPMKLDETYSSTPKSNKTTSNGPSNNSNIKNATQSYEITPQKTSYVSYDISDIKSDSEDEEETVNTKPIPSWATGVRLRNALLQQHYNPKSTDEIFGNICETPDLASIMGVKKKTYTSRTSSAIWNSPNASFFN